MSRRRSVIWQAVILSSMRNVVIFLSEALVQITSVHNAFREYLTSLYEIIIM